MPRFKVSITGEGLDRAMAALNRANIPTIGPPFTWHGDDPRPVRVGPRMSAVLDADTAEGAERRVRDKLPAEGDHTVERAELYRQDDFPAANNEGSLARHYKLLVHTESMEIDQGPIVLDAPTLPALRQRVNAFHADVDEPLTLGGFYRVEDDGLQVPFSELERDEILGVASWGPATEIHANPGRRGDPSRRRRARLRVPGWLKEARRGGRPRRSPTSGPT
jgi:hypothetical protein